MQIVIVSILFYIKSTFYGVHPRKPYVSLHYITILLIISANRGSELLNYSNLLRQSLLRQPWEQRKYPPQFNLKTDTQQVGMTHSYRKHCLYAEIT